MVPAENYVEQVCRDVGGELSVQSGIVALKAGELLLEMLV